MMKNISVNAAAHPLHKDITVISVKGFIDTTTASEFEQTFQTVLGEKRFNLIMDLKDVNYISSAGWGIFVGEIKRIRGQKGDLFLTGMCPEVVEAYDLLQFSTILKSFSDVEQAVQKGFGKARAKGIPAAKASSAPAAVVSTPEASLSSSASAAPSQIPARRKPFWLFRILMPWTWF